MRYPTDVSLVRLLRLLGLAALLLAATLPAGAQEEGRSRRRRDAAETPTAPATAPTTFAPVPADHELAGIWNDPEFTRRLIGSYGFASDVEPRLTPEEQAAYQTKVVPLLGEDPKKAVPELESLLKPGSSAVFDHTLGTIFFQAGDLTNAVRHFAAAVAKFPDFRRAQRNLAFAHVRAGDYAAAVPALGRAISLGNADGRLYGLLGFANSQLGRNIPAVGAYQQALVFEPENLDFLLGLTRAYIATGNFDAALALLDQLIQQHPDRDQFWTLQANVYLQRDQPKRAAVNLEILRKLDKITAPQLFTLGDIYLTDEARDLALAAYDEAIAKDAGQNPARALRAAEVLAARGAHADATRLLDSIRTAGGDRLDPAAQARLLKVEARVAMAGTDQERAAKTLEDLIQRDPLDGEALLLAGDFYARTGQREKAQLRYEAAAKIEGFEADALLKQAQTLVADRKYPQAIELLRKAQKIKPRDNVARYLEKVEQVARSARS